MVAIVFLNGFSSLDLSLSSPFPLTGKDLSTKLLERASFEDVKGKLRETAVQTWATLFILFTDGHPNNVRNSDCSLTTRVKTHQVEVFFQWRVR